METEIKYELVSPSHYGEIAELEKHLWGRTNEYRTQMFTWKYANAPFDDKCIGAVAVCDGKVVGFRGLIQTNWEIEGLHVNTVFTTDAVVNPEYRGRKIMANLTSFILDNIKTAYDYLIVLSPNVKSGSVYKSIGTKFFTSFVYYKKPCMLKFRKKKAQELDGIEKIWECRSKFTDHYKGALSPIITKEYYSWKMQEPEKEFKFIADENQTCFALLEIRSKNVEVFDFGFHTSIDDVLKLVESYANETGKIYVNFPMYHNQECQYGNALKKHGYHKYLWLTKIKKSFSPVKPVMIRPIEIDNPAKQYIGDLKHDSPATWNFKHLLYV